MHSFLISAHTVKKAFHLHSQQQACQNPISLAMQPPLFVSFPLGHCQMQSKNGQHLNDGTVELDKQPFKAPAIRWAGPAFINFGL
jgi:hypothetical protein